jgi:hypothetical protein
MSRAYACVSHPLDRVRFANTFSCIQATNCPAMESGSAGRDDMYCATCHVRVVVAHYVTTLDTFSAFLSLRSGCGRVRPYEAIRLLQNEHTQHITKQAHTAVSRIEVHQSRGLC